MNQAGITDEEYGNMTMEEYFTKKAAAVEDVLLCKFNYS